MIRSVLVPRLSLLLLAVLGCLLLSACKSDQDRAEAYLQSGRDLAAAGDLARAKIQLRNALDHDGFNKDARLMFAQLSRQTGDDRQAYGNYLRLVEQYPDTLQAREALAEMALEGENWRELDRHGRALARLAKGTELGRDIAALLSYRAAKTASKAPTQDMARRKIARALQPSFEQSVDDSTQPDAPRPFARHLLIDWHLSQGDPIAALPHVKAALRHRPEALRLQMRLFQLQVKTGQTEAAEATLAAAHKAHPAQDQLRQMLLSWYIQRAAFDKAEALLRARAKAAPGDARAQMAVVALFNRAGNSAAATQELTQLIAAHEGTELGLFFRANLAAQAFDTAGDEAAQTRALREIAAVLAQTRHRGDLTQTARVLWARMLTRAGDLAQARQVIEQTLRDAPATVAALKMRAGWALDAGEADKALLDLRAALNHAPRDAAILLAMAEALLAQGKAELAQQRFALAVEVATREGPLQAATAREATLRYAQFLRDRQRPFAARSLLQDARRQAPQDLELTRALAQAEIDTGTGAQHRLAPVLAELAADPRPAAQTLRAALALRSGIRLGLQNLPAGSPASPAAPAAPHHSTNLDHPAQVAVLNGDLRALRGEMDAALRLYQDGLASLPTQASGPVVAKTHAVLRARQTPDAAEALLQQALAKAPRSPHLRVARANALARGGDLAAAIDLYEALFQELPQDAVIRNNLVSLLADADTPEARARALALSDGLQAVKSPAVRDTIGWVQARNGFPDKALPLLQDARRALPQNGVVAAHLGQTYAALGDTERAVRELRVALALIPRDNLRQRALAQEALNKATLKQTALTPQDQSGEL